MRIALPRTRPPSRSSISQASAELGIGRTTIYRKMAQYGIKADQLRGW